MSAIAIESLGQERIVQPQPITEITGQVYGGLQTFWQTTRDQCERAFTPAQCRALLGVRPTILQPDWIKEKGLPWYWLVGIGFVVGKII